MLVIFITNLSIWSFQSTWLTHEIEHNLQSLSMTSQDDNKELPGSIEHQLLHAADHLQLFVTSISDIASLFSPSAVFFHFTSVALPCATLEAPFRPPRFTLHFI
jgi:hypothetical protein